MIIFFTIFGFFLSLVIHINEELTVLLGIVGYALFATGFYIAGTGNPDFNSFSDIEGNYWVHYVSTEKRTMVIEKLSPQLDKNKHVFIKISGNCNVPKEISFPTRLYMDKDGYCMWLDEKNSEQKVEKKKEETKKLSSTPSNSTTEILNIE